MKRKSVVFGKGTQHYAEFCDRNQRGKAAAHLCETCGIRPRARGVRCVACQATRAGRRRKAG